MAGLASWSTEPWCGVASERLLARLEDASCRPRRCGAGWQALCPAHDDRSPSLSVTEAHDGRVLVHCFAGCRLEEILAAVNLRTADLFEREPEDTTTSALHRTPPRRTSAPPAKLPSVDQLRAWEQQLHATPAALELAWSAKRWTPAALAALDVGWDGWRFTLPIRDRHGALVNICRYRPGAQKKALVLGGRPRDLFPAPERLREALGGHRHGIYLLEGEPDAISAVSGGILAVAVPGTHGWKPEWADRFAGMHVRVLADHDDHGRRLAETASGDLTGYAASVRVLAWPSVIGREPPAGYDLGDWLRELRPQAAGAV
jgi:hypothetical protein